ncbi:MAG: hypothetical protein B1H03_06665 [Planctomycetales bacterium 4484_113]|nr:MAG: hypothetical protein B1H03_06665 [Planctomycetales bacterium 4484_113]
MQRFFDFADGVERILVQQFVNPLLWFVFILTVYFEVLLNQIERQATRWPTEVLLAHLLGIFELSLVISLVAILTWEARARARFKPRSENSLESPAAYPPRLWLAICLLLALITVLHLCYLGYFQYVHIITLLQRALFVFLAVLIVPGLYLLLNPRLRGGFAAVSSFITSLALYLILELSVLWLSFQAGENGFFARLNDVYYWNQLFPDYARSELWLTIYTPWLIWYLLIFIALNAVLVWGVVMRSRSLPRGGEAR